MRRWMERSSCPSASWAILTPTDAPIRVAPASNIARASSIPFTPPDAFTPRLAADSPTHQRNVVHRRSAFRESSRCLYEIGTGIFCSETRPNFFFIRQQCGLDDHFAQHVILVRRVRDGANVIFDGTIVTRLQRTDIDDHVDLASAVEDSPSSFVCFNIGSVAPSGNPITVQTGTPDPRRNSLARLTQPGLTQTEAKPNSRRFLAKFSDIRFARLGLQQRVIDEARPIVSGRRFAENDTDPFGTGVNNSLNIGTAKRRAVVIAADLRKHEIRDLFDKPLVISVSVHKPEADIITFCIRVRWRRSWRRGACDAPRDISVVTNARTISTTSSNVFCPLPSVSRFAPLCSRELRARATRIARRRPDSGNLIRRHRTSDPGSIDDDTDVDMARSDRSCSCVCEVGIIDSIGRIGTEVPDLKPEFVKKSF